MIMLIFTLTFLLFSSSDSYMPVSHLKRYHSAIVGNFLSKKQVKLEQLEKQKGKLHKSQKLTNYIKIIMTKLTKL